MARPSAVHDGVAGGAADRPSGRRARAGRPPACRRSRPPLAPSAREAPRAAPGCLPLGGATGHERLDHEPSRPSGRGRSRGPCGRRARACGRGPRRRSCRPRCRRSCPGLIRTTPNVSSTRSASRIETRLTPNRSASSASDGQPVAGARGRGRRCPRRSRSRPGAAAWSARSRRWGSLSSGAAGLDAVTAGSGSRSSLEPHGHLAPADDLPHACPGIGFGVGQRRPGPLDRAVAVEQLLEQQPRLGPRDRRARAVVDAGAERDVTAELAVDVERVGVVELALVAVGRPVDDGDPAVRGDRDAVELDVLAAAGGRAPARGCASAASPRSPSGSALRSARSRSHSSGWSARWLDERSRSGAGSSRTRR